MMLLHFKMDFYFCSMLPDFPHKRFNDCRANYCLLMEVLAMDKY